LVRRGEEGQSTGGKEGARERGESTDIIDKIDTRFGFKDVDNDLSLSLQTGPHQWSSAILGEEEQGRKIWR
jgi:hypothetical protein